MSLFLNLIYIFVASIFCILSFGIFVLANALYEEIKRLVICRIKHYKTRNTKPVEGQVWERPNGLFLKIDRVEITGDVRIEISSPGGQTIYWTETPERWTKRINYSKYFLSRIENYDKN